MGRERGNHVDLVVGLLLVVVVMTVGIVCAVCWGGGNVVVNAVGTGESGKRERELEKQREFKFL